MKMHELLSDESKWCRGQFALDVHGNPVSPDNPEACQFCLRGAVYHCYLQAEEYYQICERLNTECYDRFNAPTIIVNDHRATFAEIRQMLLDLDI